MFGGGGSSTNGPPFVLPKPMEFAFSAPFNTLGDMKFGRIQWLADSLTATKTTSVVAMAGSVRRMSTPVTPSAKAKAA
jgi:hypothetical protein